MTRSAKLAIGSVLIGITVLALKFLAYWITGSVALLSDAMESIVNIATAFAALVAIHVADQPADDNHPFGHHKAEFFSTLFEGVMIVLAAAFILKEAYGGLIAPKAIEAPVLGLAVTAVATVFNGAWARFLIREGGRENSPALVADGHHLWVDVLTTIGIGTGVVLTAVTGWHILDPLMAAAIALHIFWAGAKVLKTALSGLMDETVSQERMERLVELIIAQGGGAVEAHDLRTRHAGRANFVEFHLVVPGDMSVHDAHEICDRIERAIKAEMADTRVTIHVEPEHKSKPEEAIDLGDAP